MPQTSPMNWMIMSCMIMYLTVMTNLSFNKKITTMNKNNSSIMKKTMNWKW